MDRVALNNILQHLGHQQLRDILANMLDTYCIPSFGSMSKHDIDLLMFDSMVRMGVISDNPTIYDVMRDLKVTRSKARTLIYEFQLRKVQNEEQLREQLRDLMKTPLMSTLSKNVCLEVDNPYLVDFIRNELKRLGFITDGSFHAELVKMSTEAFASLYENVLSEQGKQQIHDRLVALGVKPDTSLKKILPHLMKGVAKTMASAAMGKVGEDIAEDCIQYVGDNIDALKETLGNFFNNED